MKFGVEQKLKAFAAMSMVFMLVVGGVGYWGQKPEVSALTDMSVKLLALRNHLTSDTMHHAVRADVLRALLAGSHKDTATLSEVRSDITEHATLFREKTQECEALELPENIKSEIDKVKPDLTTYIAGAEKMVALSSTDVVAAKRQFGEFSALFSKLEGSLAAR